LAQTPDVGRGGGRFGIRQTREKLPLFPFSCEIDKRVKNCLFFLFPVKSAEIDVKNCLFLLFPVKSGLV
jgi:hypothetical protein